MQLIIDFDKMSSTKEQSVQVSQESGVPIETQTSLPVESIDRPDIRDDEVLECITTQNDQPLESELIDDDEVDEATKQASSVVFTELKSILHLEVRNTNSNMQLHRDLIILQRLFEGTGVLG